MNSRAEYVEECANQFINEVAKERTTLLDRFLNWFKEDNDKGYEVIYGLIDLRGQL